MNTPLLARLAALPGYTATQLPDPTEVLLDDLTYPLGEAEAYDLWLGVLFARAAAATPTSAGQLAAWVGAAGDAIGRRQAGSAAHALVRRLPDWRLAIQTVAAALPTPALTPPGPGEAAAAHEPLPLPELLEQLFGLFLKAHWTLYRHLPDHGRALANALADELPAVLRRDGLRWGLGVAYVLKEASRPYPRLAALVSEALGTYPARARWIVLRWAHKALHDEPPRGLNAFAKALAQAAPAWPDAAFDLLLREAVLYVQVKNAHTRQWEPQLAPALVFRRQPERRAVLEALHAQHRPTPEAAQLAALLAAAQQPEAAPAAAAPPPEAVALPNLVLRLGIIHELMYKRGLLGPRFDVHQFAKSYPGREIDVEEDGYAVIPEVADYFMQLPLTPALLLRLKKLNFEFGKPELDIVFQVFPFDDGEGDELRLTSLAGIEHCANLEEFSMTQLAPGYPLPSLAPLLALPRLRRVLLDEQFADAPDPAYAELQRRGLL